jgi:exopolysaccharide biosynthesis protein
MHDLVAIMREAGASDAMNMDGGYSTTLVYWNDASGEPVVCNRPTPSGYMRFVGANMGIYVE